METTAIKQFTWLLEQVDKKTIEEYLFQNCDWKISEQQKSLFIQIAIANKLNPFKRQIYAVPFWNSETRKMDMQPITSYTVYLERANLSGQLDWRNVEVKKNKDWTVESWKITIHRKDRRHAFEREVVYDEIKQTKKDWEETKQRKENPVFMTKKVAIAQWMRMAFPEYMSWMPYTKEEFRENDDKPRQVQIWEIVQEKEEKQERQETDPNKEVENVRDEKKEKIKNAQQETNPNKEVVMLAPKQAKATKKQIDFVSLLKGKCDMSDEDFKSVAKEVAWVESRKDLTRKNASKLIDELLSYLATLIEAWEVEITEEEIENFYAQQPKAKENLLAKINK